MNGNGNGVLGEDLLRPTEVAKRLGVSRQHVYKLIRIGVMPVVRVSPGCPRVTPEDLAEYIKRRRRPAKV